MAKPEAPPTPPWQHLLMKIARIFDRLACVRMRQNGTNSQTGGRRPSDKVKLVNKQGIWKTSGKVDGMWGSLKKSPNTAKRRNAWMAVVKPCQHRWHSFNHVFRPYIQTSCHITIGSIRCWIYTCTCVLDQTERKADGEQQTSYIMFGHVMSVCSLSPLPQLSADHCSFFVPPVITVITTDRPPHASQIDLHPAIELGTASLQTDWTCRTETGQQIWKYAFDYGCCFKLVLLIISIF